MHDFSTIKERQKNPFSFSWTFDGAVKAGF
jgi:hypothetical protein